MGGIETPTQLHWAALANANPGGFQDRIREGIDAQALLAAGVAAVYTPKDWDLNRTIADIVALVGERHGVAAATAA